MPKHVLDRGRGVIPAVVALGEAPGYAVAQEHAVEKGRNPPAVDVAWFADPGDRLPLMIFGVESRATSGIANNALVASLHEVGGRTSSLDGG